MISHCSICQRHRFSKQKEPLMSHKIPELPWECVGTDLFMWNNEQYLIIVDYYSQFFEFEKLHTLTSQTVINKHKNIFARHGNSPITDLSSCLSCLPTLLRHMPSLTRPPALIIRNQMDWLKKLLGLPNVCLLKQGKVKVIFHLVCWNTGTHLFVVQLHQPSFLSVEICTQFHSDHQTSHSEGHK